MNNHSPPPVHKILRPNEEATKGIKECFQISVTQGFLTSQEECARFGLQNILELLVNKHIERNPDHTVEQAQSLVIEAAIWSYADMELDMEDVDAAYREGYESALEKYEIPME
ncbi:hypothetical protein CBF23_003155 [Marinomonas agarivorans]|nr:hypothetical protein CBF23_003155 [Marinomonas agarivorans]